MDPVTNILASASLGKGLDPDITIPNPFCLPNFTVLSSCTSKTGVPDTLLAENKIPSLSLSSILNKVPLEPSILKILDPLPNNFKDWSWLDEDMTNDPVIIALPEKGNLALSSIKDAVWANEAETAFRT